ncbi:MAG: 50S ribosomal protein L6 [Candidatus Andersenbacteria bacterium]
MSRIGKQPIPFPSNVTVEDKDGTVHVKGPKGELSYTYHPGIGVIIKDGEMVCTVVRKSKQSGALWGTNRANLANLVLGVQEGFKKQLELHGVGYRAHLKGKDIELAVGYSHPVLIKAPEGITFTVEKEVITIEGIDTNLVGQVSADIRKVRPPEPYKGKGIRYVGEKVRRKVGKVVGASGG